MANANPVPCDIVFTGCDEHRGEYWYSCNTCGWSDWVSRNDSFSRNEQPYNCKVKDLKMKTQADFAKAVEAVFLEADCCSDFMHEEVFTPAEARESGMDEEWVSLYEATGVTEVSVAVHYGGEGCGDSYFCVVKFTDGHHTAYLKFDGWYASHYGSEFQSVFLVEPVEKLVTVYE